MPAQYSLRASQPGDHRLPLKFSPDAGSDDGHPRSVGDRGNVSEGEDLPYKVELWDATKTSVEQVLAVTANASIGYAAYYAATREHAERYITLRHKNGIVSRWNGPSH